MLPSGGGPSFHYPPPSSRPSSTTHFSFAALPPRASTASTTSSSEGKSADSSLERDALAVTIPTTPSHFRQANSPRSPHSPRSPTSPTSPPVLYTPRLHHSPPPGAADAAQDPLTAAERASLFHALAAGEAELSRSALTHALLGEAKALKMEDAPTAVDTLVHHLWSLPSQHSLPPSLSATSFDALAQHWHVPSQALATEVLDAKSRVYESELPIGRRLLAHWSVEGPMSTFVILFCWLQTALGVYYFVHYAQSDLRDVLGWGLPFAKGAAGVLYPTLAFLLLASCRRLATFLRRWRWVSLFVNWDRSAYFHAFLGVTVLVFATIHAISHLAGTFRDAAANPDSPLLSNHFPHPVTYRAMVGTRAGITGIIAFAILLLIVATSHPRVRRSRFQLFQYTHLLIWPFVALLLAHGTDRLIASPVLGYWLIVPLLCVLWDRVPRLLNMFRPVHDASFEVLADSTVVLSIPASSVTWQYKPGQYLLVRVQEVSFGEWHPFTVVGSTKEAGGASGTGTAGRVYMRKAGDWTGALLQRVKEGKAMTVTLDGPFGSPSESLSTYSRIVVVGTGIGVTPYAGWLHDMAPSQVVHFHWVVREQISFTWFAALLNTFHLRSDAQGGGAGEGRAQVNVRTYATGLAPTSTVQYVLRVLLEKHRTISHSTSYVTGLECETKYGRPDIATIFEGVAAAQEEREVEEGDGGIRARARRRKREGGEERKGVVEGVVGAPLDERIGVFYCGPNYLGMEISDRCRMETLRTGVRWEFVGEVF